MWSMEQHGVYSSSDLESKIFDSVKRPIGHMGRKVLTADLFAHDEGGSARFHINAP